MAGDFNLVMSWAEARFALSQTPHDSTRMHLVRYPSGHMPYLGAESRAALRADLDDFVRRLAR
ncbi:hypothetical protein [Microbacterium sp. H83]|uniref:hypothetical protein n=1 Tax=Microbacterium sp. H83 TaxID=1827324 RepID=UPI000AA7DFD1|nr:hypothetical protein [Microbacterium sp. H83]